MLQLGVNLLKTKTEKKEHTRRAMTGDTGHDAVMPMTLALAPLQGAMISPRLARNEYSAISRCAPPPEFRLYTHAPLTSRA